jgi:hypothetical protein
MKIFMIKADMFFVHSWRRGNNIWVVYNSNVKTTFMLWNSLLWEVKCQAISCSAGRVRAPRYDRSRNQVFRTWTARPLGKWENYKLNFPLQLNQSLSFTIHKCGSSTSSLLNNAFSVTQTIQRRIRGRYMNNELERRERKRSWPN